jgi:hypothetical protein
MEGGKEEEGEGEGGKEEEEGGSRGGKGRRGRSGGREEEGEVDTRARIPICRQIRQLRLRKYSS